LHFSFFNNETQKIFPEPFFSTSSPNIPSDSIPQKYTIESATKNSFSDQELFPKKSGKPNYKPLRDDYESPDISVQNDDVKFDFVDNDYNQEDIRQIYDDEEGGKLYKVNISEIIIHIIKSDP